MKKIILLSVIAIFTLALSSCGPRMYRTQSSGKDNVAYVTVLTEGSQYGANTVVVVVDNVTYPYGKVYKVKRKVKSVPIVIEPGKHNIKIVVNGQTVKDENVFLAVQESKVFIIQ